MISMYRFNKNRFALFRVFSDGILYFRGMQRLKISFILSRKITLTALLMEPKVLECFKERFNVQLSFEESARDAIVAVVCNPKYKLRCISYCVMKAKDAKMFLGEFQNLTESSERQ